MRKTLDKQRHNTYIQKPAEFKRQVEEKTFREMTLHRNHQREIHFAGKEVESQTRKID